MKNFAVCDFDIRKIDLACLVKAGRGSNLHRNRPSHGVAVFLGGKRTLHFDQKNLTVPGNSIVYFPKGSNYTIDNDEYSDCYAINFQLAADQHFEPFSVTVDNINTYLPDFITATKVWNRRNPSYQLKIKSALYNILYNLQNECTGNDSHCSSLIQPAVNFIHDHFLTADISIPELADLCGISEVYLRRQFNISFGMAPNRYIKNLRLQYAAELLLSGFYRINEVCYLSGFNDESYFSREFKKHFGESPTEYAERST